ncbi:hypothetical protein NQZ68_030671 [Dissostichus eleginoides]|nr:hypothetical protein NQZ68_030671 [Dissostichus eleginoides]
MAERRENEGDEELNKARPRVSKVWEYFTDDKPKKSLFHVTLLDQVNSPNRTAVLGQRLLL